MDRHRIGIIGCGGIAHAHIKAYRTSLGELCDVVAGCDVNRETLAAFCDRHDIGLRFADAVELLDSGEVDVIALLTPPSVRAEVILPAAERGIHMLVEKPFGECLADAAAFVEAAGRAGVKIAVNHELRFNLDVIMLRMMIQSGRLGRVLCISHDHFYDRRVTRGWRADEERLEISIFSIHLIDRIQWLAGRLPVAVTAMTRHWGADVRGETFTALTVEFEGGLIGSMVSNWHSPALPECRLRVDGTEGTALSLKGQITDDECTLLVATDDGERQELDASRPEAFVTAMGESMSRLLEAIDDDVEPVNNGRDNLTTMAIVDAAYLSAARGGGRVDVAQPLAI